jgi:ABC-type spermidine/putrescine transport system permease subunit II
MTAVLVEPVAVPTKAVRRSRNGIGRIVVLALAAIYFLVPLTAAVWFTVEDKVHGGVTGEYYTSIPQAEGFADALRRSLSLAVLTVLGVLLVTVPAMLAVTLRLPKLRPIVEGLSLLPLVIPPIALVAGVRDMLALGPDQLAGTPLGDFLVSSQDPELPYILIIVYIVLATPFAYRSLDAGIRSIDARTLVDAARGLGASWSAVVFRVLLPNLRSAVLGAAFLTLGLVLGEYTIASILLFDTLPTWLVKISGSSGQLSVAVSTASLLFTWLLLLVVSLADRRRSSGSTT